MNTFWRVVQKLYFLLLPDGPYGDRRRGKFYEPFLKSCGKNFKVASQAFIYNPSLLSVGDNVYIGFNSYIGQGEVFLDDEVIIGNFVSITASNHLKKNGSYRFGGFEAKPIFIGQGTWLCAHSCILSGVSISRGCLVAAGAIVTKNFPEHLILAGVPAAVISQDHTDASLI